MTLQDDIARHWFQPSVPIDAPQDRVRPIAPRTTRIAGELPLDEASSPLPPRPAPRPSRVEVTQPYIPAIRDQTPEFLKRLSPGPAPTTRPVSAAAPAPSLPRPEPTVQRPAPAAQPPAAPAKRRSLARRVIRRIIGPDLLRKDPPKPAKKKKS